MNYESRLDEIKLAIDGLEGLSLYQKDIEIEHIYLMIDAAISARPSKLTDGERSGIKNLVERVAGAVSRHPDTKFRHRIYLSTISRLEMLVDDEYCKYTKIGDLYSQLVTELGTLPGLQTNPLYMLLYNQAQHSASLLWNMAADRERELKK